MAFSTSRVLTTSATRIIIAPSALWHPTLSALFGAMHVRYYGTLLQAFSFDAPVVSHLPLPNAATTGRASITIAGFNFGTKDYTLTAILSNTQCSTTSWKAPTQLSCLSPAATSFLGSGQPVIVTVADFVGTFTQAFTFDAPVLTFTARNGPTTGGLSLTIAGSNFGTSLTGSTPSSRIGGTPCVCSQWITTTSVICTVAPGMGSATWTALTIAAVHGSLVSLPFSFDAPTVTYFLKFNGPSTNGGSVTVLGQNFGAANPTPTAGIGLTRAASVAWVTATHVRAGLDAVAGALAPQALFITISNAAGTSMGRYSFDAPFVTSVNSASANSVTTAGASISLLGLNFGLFDATLSASFASVTTMCRTTSWTTTTAVVCAGVSDTGAGAGIMVFGSAPGTALRLFSYDGPVVTSLRPFNGPISGAPVTVLGTNYGSASPTPTVSISQTLCTTSRWMTQTQLICTAPSSLLHDLGSPIFVQIASTLGTALAMFTYNAPAPTSLLCINMPTTGSLSVSILGVNFGVVDASPTLQLGSSNCKTSSWQSATLVRCSAPSGAGLSGLVALTIGVLIGTASVDQTFTYDGPVVTMFGVNAVTTQQTILSLAGINFGIRESDCTPTVAVGSTVCTSAHWTSVTQVICRSPAGTGGVKDLRITISERVGSLRGVLTFDAPVITQVQNQNLALTAGLSMTLSGTNFGIASSTVTVRVGLTFCGTSSWQSVTSAVCGATLYGDGSQHSLVGLIDGLGGTRIVALTYDAPLITQIGTQHPTAFDFQFPPKYTAGCRFQRTNNRPALADTDWIEFWWIGPYTEHRPWPAVAMPHDLLERSNDCVVQPCIQRRDRGFELCYRVEFSWIFCHGIYI